ncbi:MAG: bis(5'-nucleosyl)-tetraphosphatase (symmetrical) YqeK [Clostridia bacterium]|nr:bis(5'-nucleosyl)-tetraphosphatase (symmetrical) YqeK [Clostridia bacterium]
MCRLAFRDMNCEISDIELKRGDKSYTVDTLREIRNIFPDDELFFIIGSDMLSTFRQWYRWEDILSMAKICAASRENGFEPDWNGYSPEQRERFVFVETEPLEVSSTELRSGDKPELLDSEVARYIKDNGLYDDGLSEYRKLLKEKLDDYRLDHSECVSECAAVLAEKYGADPEKARLAGLLHDVMKNASDAEHFLYMDNISSIELHNRKVWHQISGEGFLREKGIISDEEILGAVRWHTTGRAGMTLLEKIVYVADFISADRKYKDVDVVRRLAQLSLEHAILYTSRYTIEKLAGSDMLIHPATVECYNDMVSHFRKGQVK